jgi:glycosyltransferase involved in cell wall biosynthesis
VIKNAVGDIIASLRYLPERVKLLIIGTGYLEQSLRKQAASYQLQHRVSFLGFIPHDALPEYLHAADIFCRPSLSEGFGNSFIEAMAAGLPVITTPVGGIVDFLRDKETGLFCKVGDPKSIADAVLLLEEQPALREAIISSARRMVEQKYDWDIVAKQMRAVFEKSITNKR